MVLTLINEGLVVSAFASSIALPKASISLPSFTSIVWKPKLAIRPSTSSVNAISVLPSIEILFESYITISFESPKVPANEKASDEIPSIRQPSPPST